MAGVIIESFNAQLSALGGVVREFDDDFNRANTSFGFGANWIDIVQPGALLGETFSIGSNELLIQESGFSQVQSLFVGFSPIPVMSGLYLSNQFATLDFLSNTSVSGSRLLLSGPSVFMTLQNNTVRGYIFCTSVDAANFRTWTLAFVNANAFTTLVSGPSGSHQYNAGDEFRLEGVLGVGQTELDCLINGVSVATFVDNTASRCTSGVPGFARARVNTNNVGLVLNSWDNFTCGQL